MTVTLKLLLLLLLSTLVYCKPPDAIKFRNRRVKPTTIAPTPSSSEEYENVTTESSTIKTVEDPEAKNTYLRPQRGETYQKGPIAVGSRWESEKTTNSRIRMKPRLHPTKPPVLENYPPISQNSDGIWTNDETPYSTIENPELSWNEQAVKYKVIETDEYPSVDDIPWTPMIKMPTGEIVEDRLPEETALPIDIEQLQTIIPTPYKPAVVQQKPVIVHSNPPKSEFEAWIKPSVEPTKFYSKPIVVPEILPRPEPQKWPNTDQKLVHYNQKAPVFDQFVNFDQKWPVVEQKTPNYYYSKAPRVVRGEMPRWAMENYQNLRQSDWNNNYNGGQRMPNQQVFQNGNVATSYSNSMLFYEPQQKQPRSSHLAAASSNSYEVVPHMVPMRPRSKHITEIIHPTIYQIIRYPATLEDVQAHLSELPAMSPPLDQFLNHQNHHHYSHLNSYKSQKFRPSTHLPDYMMPQPVHRPQHRENFKPSRIPNVQEIRLQQQNYAKKYLREHPPKIRLKPKKHHLNSLDQIQQAASSEHPTSQTVDKDSRSNDQENSKEFNSKSDIEKPNQNEQESTVDDNNDADIKKDFGDLEKTPKSSDHQNH